jgi:hypothetical protein
METLSDLRTAIQSDLTVGSESTLYSPTAIDLAVNRAYRKAAGLFPWPELQDAKKTVTVASQEYYDYPDTWRSNSIWKLTVNGDRWGEDPDGSPLTFDDYLNWKTDNSDDTSKKWANFNRQYFIFPVPTTADLEICVWGKKVVTTMTSDSDTTVFSYSTPEVNEAVVLEAMAILRAKADNDKGAEFKSMEAKQILATSWGKIRQEMAKYEKNMPFFDVPDFFGARNSRDMRGRFDI